MLLVSILWLFSVCANDGQITQIEFTVIAGSYFTPVADALIVRQQSIALSDSAATDCARSCVNSLNRCDVVVYSDHDQTCRVYINTGGFHRSSPGYTTFIGSGMDPSVEPQIPLPVTSKWVAVGSMSVARRTHTATLLNSGKVLVAGGRDETVAHASCELYDPDTETWSITGSMASPRSRHTAVRLTINDTDVVFVFGGSRTINFDPVVVIEYYNGTSGVWRTIVDPMRQGRFSHTTTLLLDGRLLSTGGQGNTSKLASTEIFDPVTLTSQMVGSLNFARYQHTATIMSTTGDVLVTGGVGVGNVFLSSCELFNINSRNWSWAANMSYSRSLGTMIPLMPASSSLLITGGQAINISVSSNQLYNPLTKTLSTSSSLNLGRYAHTSTLMYYQSTALVLVTGGVDPLLQITESTELYVVANSTWLNIANMTSRRGLHSATLLSGSSPSILLTGGLWNRSGINLRTAERIIFT